MISEKDEHFKLYQKNEHWDETLNGTNILTAGSGSSWSKGLTSIMGYLSLPVSEHTQFIVVYDADCPNKERNLKTMLAEINKIKLNNLYPTQVVSIGHEHTQLPQELLQQSGAIKEVAKTETPDEVLRQIVTNELNNIKQQILAIERTEHLQKSMTAPPTITIRMDILSGFIATVGISAVAVAFTLLNAAIFGTFGLGVVTALAITATTLSGIGFFSACYFDNKIQNNDDESNEYSTNLARL